MQNLFALQGPANCGKSETLIRLYQVLQSKYPDSTIKRLDGGGVNVAVIMDGIDSQIVGIESQGDPGSRLKTSLAKFSDAGCDVIFCACRTRGMTVRWVKELSRAYAVRFVKQNIVRGNHDAENEAAAAALLQRAGL